MKHIFAIVYLFIFLSVRSQTEYEIIIYNADVSDFDVFGEDAYEKKNRTADDITEKVQASVSTTAKAEPANGETFEPKNLLDGNMKTCWLTPGDGKNEQFEIVVDLEDVENVNSATLRNLYFFNGWRKDYHTWKDYSRIKKVTVTVNSLPYCEITFEDTYKAQSIELEKLKLDKTRRSRLKFMIVDTYKGAKYNQCALSDVQLVGKVK